MLLEEAVLIVLREADNPSQLAEIAEAAGMLGEKKGGAGRTGSRKESSTALRNRDLCGRFGTGSVDGSLRPSSLFRFRPLPEANTDANETSTSSGWWESCRDVLG